MQRLIDADALKYEPLPKGERNYRTYNLDDAYEDGYHDAFVDVMNAPTIDAEPHWIPCSERLPEDDRSKVVTLANGNTEVGYYSNGDWWCIGESFRLENPTVIAWMPLPKPYEVKE